MKTSLDVLPLATAGTTAIAPTSAAASATWLAHTDALIERPPKRTWKSPSPAGLLHECSTPACYAQDQRTLDGPRPEGKGKGGYFLRSFRTSRAAFRPGSPVTPPPGCVPAPHR